MGNEALDMFRTLCSEGFIATIFAHCRHGELYFVVANLLLERSAGAIVINCGSHHPSSWVFHDEESNVIVSAGQDNCTLDDVFQLSRTLPLAIDSAEARSHHLRLDEWTDF